MAKKPTKYIVTDGEMVLTLEVAEEGGYTVTSPFMKGLVTEADTLEEAFEMARDAVAGLKEVRAGLKQSPTGAKK
jgi:antitoxin HicB